MNKNYKSVSCPICKAKIHEPCIENNKIINTIHASRVKDFLLIKLFKED